MDGTESKYLTLGGLEAKPRARWGYITGAKGPSGFGSKSTAAQVAANWDGNGKVVLITGASTGLGAESARVLAARGAKLVLVVRNEAATSKVVDNIKKESPQADIRIIKCDLESLPSVVTAAKQFLDMKLPLHVLMLNAGVMAPPFKLTEQGYELQIGVNHLAHVLLARYLLPVMAKTAKEPGAPQCRVVALSSTGHHLAPRYGMRARDKINSKEGFQTWAAYGQSKLANLLFARELAARINKAGVDNVTAVSVHPGVIPGTELFRHLGKLAVFVAPLLPFMKSVPTGAATQVYCATAPNKLPGGEYFADCNIAPSSPHAHNAALGAKLWAWTEEQLAPYIDKSLEAEQPCSWQPSPLEGSSAQQEGFSAQQ